MPFSPVATPPLPSRRLRSALTLASLGCHPLTALTALTVQDTTGVYGLHPVVQAQTAEFYRSMIKALDSKLDADQIIAAVNIPPPGGGGQPAQGLTPEAAPLATPAGRGMPPPNFSAAG